MLPIASFIMKIFLLSFLFPFSLCINLTLSPNSYLFRINNCENICTTICDTMLLLGGKDGAINSSPQLVLIKEDVPSFFQLKIEIDIYYNTFPTLIVKNNGNLSASSTKIASTSLCSPTYSAKDTITFTFNSDNKIEFSLSLDPIGTGDYAFDDTSAHVTIIPCSNPQCGTCSDQSTLDCINCKNSALQSTPKCDCQTKYFWDKKTSQCEKCDYKCQTCSEFADNCLSCIAANRDVGNNCECNPYFVEDFTPPNYTCNCPSANFRIPNMTNNQCECQLYYYQLQDKAQCEQCTQKCQVCQYNPQNCIKCDTGRDTKNNCDCSCGYHDTGGVCNFGNGSLELKSNNTCGCKDGYYPTTINADCEKCNPKCKNCSSLTQCTTCQDARDIALNCGCVSGYYEPTSTSPTCSKCKFQCKECVNSDSNCTQCRGDRQNAPSCTCPDYKYDELKESCSDCHFSCQRCSDKLIDSCTSCPSDRVLHSGKCECRSEYYQIFNERACGICSDECRTCLGHPNYCLSCSYSGDIQKDGYCYCNINKNKVRKPDGTCEEKREFECKIFSELDPIQNQNLIIAQFSEPLAVNLNKDRVKNFLQFDLVVDGVQISSTVVRRILTQNENKRMLFKQSDIYFEVDSIDIDKIVYRLVSKDGFSSLQIVVRIVNSEFVFSENGHTLPLSLVNLSLALNLPMQYNTEVTQSGVQFQLNVLNSLQNLFSLFRSAQYTFIWQMILPIVQFFYLVQMLPVLLPQNIYNMCRTFSYSSLQTSQKWGATQTNNPNSLYGTSIFSEADFQAPLNFQRLGFSSNFFSNALEPVIILLSFIFLNCLVYAFHNSTFEWAIKNKDDLKKVFAFFHNLMSHLIEGTIFIITTSFWLNVIYLENMISSILSGIFGMLTMTAVIYLLYYQACLLRLSTRILANRHMSNLLVVCHWYQAYFKIMRYSKKIILISVFVIFNSFPLLQIYLISIILLIYMLISIRIRPYMYTIDNIILISTDALQFVLSLFLISIVSHHEYVFKNSTTIYQKDVEKYMSLGWTATTLILILVLIGFGSMFLSLKRVIQFWRSDQSWQETRYEIYIIQNSKESTPDEGVVKKFVIQQADKEYLENFQKAEIENALQQQKKNYFQAVLLNPISKQDFIKENPPITQKKSIQTKKRDSQSIIELTIPLSTQNQILKTAEIKEKTPKEETPKALIDYETTNAGSDNNNASQDSTDEFVLDNPFLKNTNEKKNKLDRKGRNKFKKRDSHNSSFNQNDQPQDPQIEKRKIQDGGWLKDAQHEKANGKIVNRSLEEIQEVDNQMSDLSQVIRDHIDTKDELKNKNTPTSDQTNSKLVSQQQSKEQISNNLFTNNPQKKLLALDTIQEVFEASNTIISNNSKTLVWEKKYSDLFQ